MTTEKFRDRQIQEELYAQQNPQTTPSDMLQRWPTNSRTNEQLAQLDLKITLCDQAFHREYRGMFDWFIDRLENDMHNIDGWSKTMAIEAVGKGTPGIGAQADEKKKGLLGMFKR